MQRLNQAGGEAWVLHHGDSIAAMAKMPDASVDAVITDPPYANTDLEWDTPVDWPAWWAQVKRVRRPGGAVVMFACGRFLEELIATNRSWRRYRMVWVKDTVTGFLSAASTPLRSFEDIVVFSEVEPAYWPQMRPGEPYKVGSVKKACVHYGGQSGQVKAGLRKGRYPTDVLLYSINDGEPSVHPTQKPVALMMHLVASYVPHDGVVLDPFTGSGSTGVASLRCGRRFIGVERDPVYFAKASARIGAATPDLFSGTPTMPAVPPTVPPEDLEALF